MATWTITESCAVTAGKAESRVVTAFKFDTRRVQNTLLPGKCRTSECCCVSSRWNASNMSCSCVSNQRSKCWQGFGHYRRHCAAAAGDRTAVHLYCTTAGCDAKRSTPYAKYAKIAEKLFLNVNFSLISSNSRAVPGSMNRRKEEMEESRIFLASKCIIQYAFVFFCLAFRSNSVALK